MATPAVEGRKLEITVASFKGISGNNTRAGHLYAVVRYGGESRRTRYSKCGGSGIASFSEKFIFELVDNLKEIDVAVWKKSTWEKDKLVAFSKVYLEDQILNGLKSRKMWQLHRQPKHGADIVTAGEAILEINCPVSWVIFLLSNCTWIRLFAVFFVAQTDLFFLFPLYSIRHILLRHMDILMVNAARLQDIDQRHVHVKA
ncbi:unnamed protein product [Victoria cruziana]